MESEEKGRRRRGEGEENARSRHAYVTRAWTSLESPCAGIITRHVLGCAHGCAHVSSVSRGNASSYASCVVRCALNP
jgi:hypothetical protein